MRTLGSAHSGPVGADRRRSRRAPTATVLSAALALSACSGDADDPAPATAPRHAATHAGPAEARRFEGWRPPDAAWLGELKKRIDPRADGWPSEHAALAVERVLGPRLERLLRAEAELDELLAERCAGVTELAPEELAPVWSDGRVHVSRWAGAGLELLDRHGARTAFARWRARLGGGAPRVECRVVGVEALPDGAFRCALVVRAAALADPVAVQHIARWDADFEVSADGARVAARRIALAAFEECRAPALFADVTLAAFGALPGWTDELARGSRERLGHEDRLNGQDLIGSHGVAVGDVDGDGLEDVYVAQPGGRANLLLLHQPDGTARAAGPEAGVAFLDATLGVLIVDLDGDGARDIAAALEERVIVAWNDGAGRFPETSLLPSAGAHSFYSLSAADPDADGDLDLYGCRYMAGAYIAEGTTDQAPTPYHDAQNGAPDVYWRNEGGRRFTDAGAAVGLDQDGPRFSLAALWEDLDGDRDLDLFVTNDFGRNNLYRNDGGAFTDVAVAAGAGAVAAGMGVSCADIEHDGDLDLLISNMHSPAGLRVSGQPAFLAGHPELRPFYRHHASGNTLLENQGGGRFVDATEKAGIGPGGWAWGARLPDLNNDGFADIYVPNGFVTGTRDEDLESYFWRVVIGSTPPAPPPTRAYSYAWESLRDLIAHEGYGLNGRERNYVYLNAGGGRFVDVSAPSRADFQDDARCAVTLDWDGDGRIDLLVRNRTGPGLRLLRNVYPDAGGFLALELVGTGANRDAVGARVELVCGGERLSATVYAGDGYLGCSSRRLHFGLGEHERADELVVRWPDGAEQRFADVAGNARYRLERAQGRLEAVAPRAPAVLPAAPAAASPGPAARIVLADRLPMAAIRLPLGPGAELGLDSLAGDVVLIYVTDLAPPEARAELAALAALGPELAALGARLVPVAIGSAEQRAAAGETLARQGLAREVVPGEQRALKALQLMLLEVLGPFDGLPLPVVFVLDRAGELVAIHHAPLDARALLADARAAGAEASGPRSCERLLGGRWLRAPRRNLELVGYVFQLLGEQELARRYTELARERHEN